MTCGHTTVQNPMRPQFKPKIIKIMVQYRWKGLMINLLVQKPLFFSYLFEYNWL